MMPQHFQGQPPFPPHMRHHTPSASPPIPNGVVFAQHAAQHIQRGHTPQPQIGSRPGSRNDMRRMGPNMVPQPVGPPGPPQGPPVNGYAFMPHPAIYNPQNPPNVPPNMSQPGPQYPYPPPPPHAAPHMQPYMEDQRRSSLPPNYPPQQPPAGPRHSVSPPQHHQQIPPQPIPHSSPPQPQHPQIHSSPQPPPHPQVPQIKQEPPPAPVEPRAEGPQDRPQAPLLDTNSAIKKLPQRKQHSIFTPIDENRSILSQHLAAFHNGPQLEADVNGNRAQSVDVGSVSRTNLTTSPPLPKRSDTAASLPKGRQISVSSIPETTFTPPSRSNSLRVGGASRPRLRVEIPDEPSDAGSATAESTSAGPGHSTDATSQATRRNPDSHSSGVVLPPPSPSASALLSAGATGPPNPFARPPPNSQHHNMDTTPVSALPSRFLNNEFLPSPSSFYPDWNFRGSDNNTLPSPLNFATPIVGTGPSFLRDDPNHPTGGIPNNKRKSPDLGAGGPTSDPADPGTESKRQKKDKDN